MDNTEPGPEEIQHEFEKLGMASLPTETARSIPLLEERVRRLRAELAAVLAREEESPPAGMALGMAEAVRADLEKARRDLESARFVAHRLN